MESKGEIKVDRNIHIPAGAQRDEGRGYPVTPKVLSTVIQKTHESEPAISIPPHHDLVTAPRLHRPSWRHFGGASATAAGNWVRR